MINDNNGSQKSVLPHLIAGLGLTAVMILYQMNNSLRLENGDKNEEDDVSTSASIDAHLTGLEQVFSVEAIRTNRLYS